MRTETIFDRVPGCGDLKKAKRAANYMLASGRIMNRNLMRAGMPQVAHSAAYRRRIRRNYERAARLPA